MQTTSSRNSGRGDSTPRRFTATAQEHVRREKNWWLENRIHIGIFATELEEALKIVAVLPGAGAPYVYPDVPGLRRVYLRRVAYHLYYTFDEREVIVRAFWGARRDRGPIMEPKINVMDVVGRPNVYN